MGDLVVLVGVWTKFVVVSVGVVSNNFRIIALVLWSDARKLPGLSAKRWSCTGDATNGPTGNESDEWLAVRVWMVVMDSNPTSPIKSGLE